MFFSNITFPSKELLYLAQLLFVCVTAIEMFHVVKNKIANAIFRFEVDFYTAQKF